MVAAVAAMALRIQWDGRRLSHMSDMKPRWILAKAFMALSTPDCWAPCMAWSRLDL